MTLGRHARRKTRLVNALAVLERQAETRQQEAHLWFCVLARAVFDLRLRANAVEKAEARLVEAMRDGSASKRLRRLEALNLRKRQLAELLDWFASPAFVGICFAVGLSHEWVLDVLRSGEVLA